MRVAILSLLFTNAAAADHWAFQPVGDPEPPSVRGDAAVTPIDRFVIARLEAAGLSLSAEADRRTLIRRAAYDLTGLPPSPADVEAFMSDASPAAYERLIDRLSSSPHYGERWGRHWLDLARYADSKGYVFREERTYPYAYTYRDYVVRSLNEDKPYDRFVREQIAADRLDLNNRRDLAAMGFLTVGRRFLNNSHDIIDDRIDVITRTTMGLTVACARCHDHKYDPIPTADYYSLYGVLASSVEPPELPRIGDEPAGPAAEKFRAKLAQLRKAATDAHAAAQKQALAKLAEPAAAALYEKAARLANAKGFDAARPLIAKHRLNGFVVNRWREHLKGRAPRPPAGVPTSRADGLIDRKTRNKLRGLRKKADAFEAKSPFAAPRAMVLADRPQPVTPRIFQRGNPGRRGKAVPRQFLEVVAGEGREPFADGSGRRELADAIVADDNPLTARVLVNRVWMHHFGRGLVGTPSDFGTRSDPPTHPDLLDYLARRFVADGRSLKALHRLIMTSAVYRQSSASRSELSSADPENRLLGRMNRRRLSWEGLRDSLVAASGRLDRRVGGRPVNLLAGPGRFRRTVYAFVDRQNLPGVMRAFDFAGPDQHCPRRFQTTVPQQALFLMNNPAVAGFAAQLLGRPEVAAAKSDAARVGAIYRLLFARAPTREEARLAAAFVRTPLSAGPPAGRRDAWKYGYGRYDEQAKRVAFHPLPVFADGRWAGGPKLPAAKLGWVSLTSSGGHPGDAGHAAVRRWVAPQSGAVRVDGVLSHPAKRGDGVRALVVSSRAGEVGEWAVRGGKAATRVRLVPVLKGDTVDFVVGSRSSVAFDGFAWAPRVSWVGRGGTWDAAADFRGPSNVKRAGRWLQYAQALMMSNEFAFVD